MYQSSFLMRVREFLVESSNKLDDHAKLAGKILLWVVATIAIFFVFFAVRFNGLAEIDAMDHAQVARNVARGQGFTTQLIRPQSLLSAPAITHHPELTSPPLHIIVLSAMFKLFGTSDKVVVFTGAFFYFLAIPLFLFCATRMFNIRTAMLGLALYITNASLLDYSISGLQMPLLVFLFMLFLYAVYLFDEKDIRPTIAAGVLLGLCFLTQYAFGIVYFAVILHLWKLVPPPHMKKFRHMVYFTLGFLVTVSPWLYRNIALSGNPFFSLELMKPVMFSEQFSGNMLLRVARDVDFSWVMIGKVLIKKVYFGIRNQYNQLLVLPNNYLMILFFMSAFTILQNGQTFIVRHFVYIAGFLLMAVMAVFYPGVNLLVPFIPFIMMAAADYFYTTICPSFVIENAQRKVAVATALLVLVNAYPLVTRIILGGTARMPYPKDRMEMISKIVEKGQPVVTDIPWAVAWYCDRIGIWLPLTELDYSIVKKFAGGIQNIYLSPVLFEYPAAENVELWKSIFMTRKVPKTVFLAKGTYLKEGGMFLSDEPKWEKYQETKKDDETITNPVSDGQ